MTRRIALLTIVLGLATLDAQQTFRARVGRRPIEIPAVTISIQVTQGTAISTPDPTVVLDGLVQVSGDSIASVTWENTTTVDSGACNGTQTFSCGQAGGEALIFEDTFNSTIEQDLVTRGAATPLGDGYAELVDTAGNNAILTRTNGAIRPSLTDAVGNDVLLYTADPPTPVGGTNYDVEGTITLITSAQQVLMFGQADASNYCWLAIGNTTDSPDVLLGKRVAGTPSTLLSLNADPVAGNTYRVEIRGSALAVFEDDVELGSTTDSFCDDAAGFGVGFGAVSGTGAIRSGSNMDNFRVTDQDAAGGGIPVDLGTNLIDVEACTVTAVCVTARITVTRTGGDTESPALQITGPTTNATYATSTAAISPSGLATDNVGVTSVDCACATCTPTTRTTTLNGSAWAVTGAFTQASGANTLTCTAVDAAANSGADTLVSTFTTSDSTAPTVTITTNGGSNISTSTTPQVLQGTASDNVGVIGVRYVCPTCAPNSGLCTGLTDWTCSVPLSAGANTVTIAADDEAANEGTDSIVVTLSQTLSITTTALAPATVSSAYTATMLASGGTPPYTWDNNSGGSSLGGGACTGLSISSGGVVSGTPTTNGTCNFTAKVTDDVPASDTQAIALTVRTAGSEGPHDYFEDLCARPDLYSVGGVDRCFSLRTQTQINTYSQSSPNNWVTYDATIDAAKVVIPTFIPEAIVLAESMTDSQNTILVTGIWNSGFGMFTPVKIGNEIITIQRNTSNFAATFEGGNTRLFCLRGQLGTSAAAHTVGATMARGTNNLINQVRPPITTNGTADHTYLIVFDAMWDSSWLDWSDQGQKTFQLEGGYRIWFEPQVKFNGVLGGTHGTAPIPGYNANTHIGTFVARTYNGFGGVEDWSITPDGGTQGFYACTAADCTPIRAGTTATPAQPIETGFLIHPNRWTRFFFHIDNRVNDYDAITVYIADEQQEPVLIYDRWPSSIFINGPDPATANSIVRFWLEYNTSRNEMLRSSEHDMVSYFRNLVVLEDPPADWSALRLKPVP